LGNPQEPSGYHFNPPPPPTPLQISFFLSFHLSIYLSIYIYIYIIYIIIYISYIYIIYAPIHQGLADVITSARNASHTQVVLRTLLDGISSSGDCGTNKVCLQAVKTLLKLWYGPPSERVLDPPMAEFAFKDLTQRTFRCVLSGHVDFVKDANGLGVVKEAFDVQQTLAKLFNGPYLNALGEFVVTSLGVPAEAAQEYLVAVHKGEPKGFEMFKALLSSRKQISSAPQVR
jgi:hypothetical protein